MYLSEDLDKTLKRYVGRCVTVFTFGGHRFIGRLVGLVDGGICMTDAERLDDYDESNWYSSMREEERNRRKPGGGKETIVLFPQVVSISCSDESLEPLFSDVEPTSTENVADSTEAEPEPAAVRDNRQMELMLGTELFARLRDGAVSLPTRLAKIRHQLSDEYGFSLPAIRIHECEEISPHAAHFRWHALELGAGYFPPRQKFAFALLEECDLSEDSSACIHETRDAIWMAPGFFIDESVEVTSEGRNVPTMSSSEYFFSFFRSLLVRHLARFYTFDQTVKLVQQTRLICPSLIEDVIDRSSTVANVHTVFHQLVEDRCTVRPVQQILSTLKYNWDAADQLDETIANCRLVLANWLCARFRRDTDFVRGLILAPEVEARMARDRASSNLVQNIEEIRYTHRAAERHFPCALIVDPSRHRAIVKKCNSLLPGLTVLSMTEIEAAGGIPDWVESAPFPKRSKTVMPKTEPKKATKAQPK